MPINRKVVRANADVPLRMVLILSVIPADGDRAYRLADAYHRSVGEAMAPDWFHRTLHRMNRRGLVDIDGERNERIYTLTEDGEKFLKTCSTLLRKRKVAV